MNKETINEQITKLSMANWAFKYLYKSLVAIIKSRKHQNDL